MLRRLARAREELAREGSLRHFGGFVLAAVFAFITDAGILEVLTRYCALSPFAARPVGIGCAMVVSWWINRTVTFRMSTPPRVGEFAQFVAVSGTAQAINYAVFAAILLALPGTAPFTALVLACFVSMFVSYTGYRYGVFRQGRP